MDGRQVHFVRGLIIGVLVLVVAMIVVWSRSARYHLGAKNFGIVETGEVYRSGRLTPTATRRVVEKYDIKTIIDLGAYDKDPVGGRIAARTAKALDVEHHIFGLEGDGTGDPNDYVNALQIMSDPANRPVLVHCAAGAQRTGGCIVLYEHIFLDENVDNAFKKSLNHGHNPRKNTRLRPFIERWMQPIKESLTTGQPIPDEPDALTAGEN